MSAPRNTSFTYILGTKRRRRQSHSDFRNIFSLFAPRNEIVHFPCGPFGGHEHRQCVCLLSYGPPVNSDGFSLVGYPAAFFRVSQRAHQSLAAPVTSKHPNDWTSVNIPKGRLAITPSATVPPTLQRTPKPVSTRTTAVMISTLSTTMSTASAMEMKRVPVPRKTLLPLSVKTMARLGPVFLTARHLRDNRLAQPQTSKSQGLMGP